MSTHNIHFQDKIRSRIIPNILISAAMVNEPSVFESSKFQCICMSIFLPLNKFQGDFWQEKEQNLKILLEHNH